MKTAVRCYVGLGSNLDGPKERVLRALAQLEALPDTRLVARSRPYRSLPLGPADQPDYVNAVAALETTLAPLELLDHLQEIERGQGRVRGPERWGPRNLDLDLLLYGNCVLTTERLTLPHPGLSNRNFVLYPLAEIAPSLEIPGHGPLTELLARCPADGLHPLE